MNESTRRQRILHAYKIYRPEVDGGIPAVIATLSGLATRNFQHEVLVARKIGPYRAYSDGSTKVLAVTSFGSLSSTPIAPSFPFWLLARARSADIVFHHVPFPITDLAIAAFGLSKRTGLIVHWHGDIDGRTLLKQV